MLDIFLEVLLKTYAVMLGSSLMILLFCYFIFKKDLRNKKGVMDTPVWYVLIGAPVAEEIIFRLIPGLLYGTSWMVGIPVSIVFGLAHSMTRNKKKIILNFGDIHWLPATIAGLYLWHVFKEYGLGYAIFAHALNNGTTYGLVRLFEYFERKDKKKKP